VQGAVGLVERDGDLTLVDGLLADAARAHGRLLVVEGPAGIGKTVLCQEACARAERNGLVVLRAGGALLERDFGYGGVRQLFEPAVRNATAAERQELLAGAAALASPVVAAQGSTPGLDAQLADQPFAVMHGLYWFASNLADRGPLLIAVDDAHWLDSPSLRFVLYLTRRLEGMAMAVILATRPGEPQVDTALVADIVSCPGVGMLRPAPLSRGGVRELVRCGLGSADDDFVEACYQATGGVPFYVTELVGALARDEIAPSGDAAARVGELGPETVAHSTVRRLSRLGRSATAVARAVAILGRHADVDRVSVLTELGRDQVLIALDALAGVAVLHAGLPPRFAHPIVQRAIYDELGAGARDRGHRRVAKLLAAQGADTEEVASYLLLTEPPAGPEVKERLCAAASTALGRGAPASAGVYLRRALLEPQSSPARGSLLHELGRAESAVRDPGAIDHLREALGLTQDPRARVAILADLVEVLLSVGHWEELSELVRSATSGPGDSDPESSLQLEWLQAHLEGFDPRFASEFDRRLDLRRKLIKQGGKAGRPLALVLAFMLAWRGRELGDAAALIERGLDNGRFLADEGSGSVSLSPALGTLVVLEMLDQAQALAEAMIDDARRRGSIYGYVQGCAFRADVSVRRGSLVSAEADIRSTVELAQQHGLVYALPATLWLVADALLERPQLADIAALTNTIVLEPAFAATLTGAYVLEVRGRLRLQRGETEAAIADLRSCRPTYVALQSRNPAPSPWRSTLALALPASAREEALALVDEELQLARATGLPRPEGIALRARGLLEGGEAGIELLRRSLAVLENAPSALERARTLVDLGAALRRARQPVEARQPLAAGLDLAERCGADRLVGRALEELRAAGARTRRHAITGPNALTPSEERVARMAAGGMTNPEIAQALFVTAKTVENQLGRVYQKLDIRSRTQLAAALAPGLAAL
jgi:DNA-binding CsgD family transcriptional regulator